MSGRSVWCRGSKVRLSGSDAEKRSLEWISGYLASRWPDPATWGQPAPMNRPYVCPFMPQAEKIDSIWVTEWPGVQTAEETKAIVEERRDEFHDRLDPREGHSVLHKTALFVFPDVSEQDAPAAIDGVQEELKPSLMARDSMMIGQFHPWSDLDAAGDANSGQGIRPFRSPVPLIALRAMVFDDWSKFIEPGIPSLPAARDQEFLIRQQWRLGWLTAVLEWDFPQRLRKNVKEWQSEFDRISEFLDGVDGFVNRVAAGRRTRQ